MRIRVPLVAGRVTIGRAPCPAVYTLAMTSSAEYADALVIFGISGDLAFKKIFPALENLERRGRLPPTVVGVARGTTRDALLDRAARQPGAARSRPPTARRCGGSSRNS